MLKHTSSLLFVILIAYSCVPASNKNNTSIEIDFDNIEVQKILNFRNNQQVDSLLFYANSDNVTSRYLVTESFASLQSEEAIPVLQDLLTNDPVASVKEMAAYSLGQQGNPSTIQSLIAAFRSRDTTSVDNAVNGSILEACGKVGKEDVLNFIATTSTYRITDTILLNNQAKAIYRFGLNNMVSEAGTKKMVELVLNEAIPAQARLYAAHYLSRVSNLDIIDYQFRLSNQLVKEQNVNVKMALALALRNSDGNPDIFRVLKNSLELEDDYRVKINAIKALTAFPFNDTLISTLLTNPNNQIRETAADYLYSIKDKDTYNTIRALAKSSTDTLIKSKLYKAYFKQIPYYFSKSRNAARYEVLSLFEQPLSTQVQTTLISALGHDLLSYSNLEEIYDTTSIPSLKTAIGASLASIVTSDKFDAVFASSPRYARKKLLEIVTKVVEDGDVGCLYEVAPVFSNPEFKKVIKNDTFVMDALNKLILPRDVETYSVLHQALDNLRDTTTMVAYTNKATPINWELADQISDSTYFIVKTNKGIFNITPNLKAAPESVLNFTQLVNDNFYDNKIFHRVVPNFVVQTGCTRGDGYGSINSTINSEFSKQYYDDEGYVGMASAGPHTESAQWFVTHSPTPHLDGRYTIFGKVSEGMKTIHSLNVGDQILDIIKVN